MSSKQAATKKRLYMGKLKYLYGNFLVSLYERWFLEEICGLLSYQ
jgi:hypothetical protein